jgi:hypothetical protein
MTEPPVSPVMAVINPDKRRHLGPASDVALRERPRFAPPG